MSKSHLEEKLLNDILLAVLSGIVPKAPIREWRGIPKRKFSFDFAWPEYNLAIEVQGGICKPNTGHNSIIGLRGGYEKQSLAAIYGIHIIACDGKQIHTGQALAWIIQFFKIRQ